jgi:hypothetical protein
LPSILQLSAPVVEVFFQHCALQALALPLCIVGILDAKRGKRRRLAVDEGGVEGGEFGNQQTDAPTITDDVMDAEEQEMLIVRGVQQGGAQEGAAREIEGEAGLFIDERLEKRRKMRGEEFREVDE